MKRSAMAKAFAWLTVIIGALATFAMARLRWVLPDLAYEGLSFTIATVGFGPVVATVAALLATTVEELSLVKRITLTILALVLALVSWKWAYASSVVLW